MSSKRTIKEAFIFEKPILTEAVSKNGKRIIAGTAIHPIKTYHPNEWPHLRNYIEPCLERATPTLVGKPLLLNHEGKALDGCIVIEAIWNREKAQLEYKAEVTEDIVNLIRTGAIKHVSVGVDWVHSPDANDIPFGGGVIATPDGVIPFNFSFDELSLVTTEYQPGDPMSTVELWETLTETIKTAKPANGDGWVYDAKHNAWVVF